MSEAEYLGEKATHYWQLYNEHPARNRYYTGAYLLRTGSDGAIPYVYQAFHTVDPYTTDLRYRSSVDRYFKNFMTAYPTTGKPISTIHWEGIQAGINDYRYAMLAQSLIDSDGTAGDQANFDASLDAIQYTEPASPWHVVEGRLAESLESFRAYLISVINR